MYSEISYPQSASECTRRFRMPIEARLAITAFNYPATGFNGQVDLGAWMIEDMHPERLDFAVLYYLQQRRSLPEHFVLVNPYRSGCFLPYFLRH
jgi:hypothetical protein